MEPVPDEKRGRSRSPFFRFPTRPSAERMQHLSQPLLGHVVRQRQDIRPAAAAQQTERIPARRPGAQAPGLRWKARRASLRPVSYSVLSSACCRNSRDSASSC